MVVNNIEGPFYTGKHPTAIQQCLLCKESQFELLLIVILQNHHLAKLRASMQLFGPKKNEKSSTSVHRGPD